MMVVFVWVEKSSNNEIFYRDDPILVLKYIERESSLILVGKQLPSFYVRVWFQFLPLPTLRYYLIYLIFTDRTDFYLSKMLFTDYSYLYRL